MKEDKLKRFYFTEYKNDDEFVGELGLYIENLLSTQKKELLEKIQSKEFVSKSKKMYTKLDNLICEIGTMIESGTITVGALGISQNSADYIRSYKAERKEPERADVAIGASVYSDIETLLQNTDIDKNTMHALMGLISYQNDTIKAPNDTKCRNEIPSDVGSCEVSL